MSTHAHSVEALRAGLDAGVIAGRAAAVAAWLAAHGPATDREVMAGLGFSDPNAVRPRITELVAAGVLVEDGEVLDPVTDRMVRRVAVVSAAPVAVAPAPAAALPEVVVQMELFPEPARGPRAYSV